MIGRCAAIFHPERRTFEVGRRPLRCGATYSRSTARWIGYAPGRTADQRGQRMETGLRGKPLAPADAETLLSAADRSADIARVERARVALVVTIAIFALAFLLPAWPWLSGAVTIPWDAKSQFFPQVQFLATSFARGEWPWWTPNVFAGWPEISDPQSLLFSPLHVLLALFNSAISLRAVDAVTFAYLFLGGVGIILFFHDRGWHPGGALVAALAFALGGAASARIQHTGQVISLAYLALTLVALGARARPLVVAGGHRGRRARRIDGDRPRPGRAAVALCAGRIRAGALACRREAARAHARQRQAAGGRRRRRNPGRRRAGHDDDAAGGAIEPARGQLRLGRRRLDPSGASAAIRRLPICSAPWIRTSNTGRRRA